MVHTLEERPGVPSADRPGGFVAELRDAVTPRAALLVLGVLALQLGFIASYLGAFHAPEPRRIPLAVAAPDGTAGQLAARLDALPGEPVHARAVTDAAEARRLIDDREVYGALVVGPGGEDRLLVASAAGPAVATALTTVLERVEAQQHRRLTVEDVRPPEPRDARGLSGFYLVIGWVVGGYLVAAILGIGGGNRPANRHRALIRLGALAAYAVASGVGGALVAETVLSALTGHFAALSAFGALLVFAVGAVTMALQVLLGIPGIGVAIVLFVILGNPSAGGAYPAPLLPPFWAAIGPWLPPGAGTDGVRAITYFGGAGVGRDCAVLAVYALAGAALTLLFAGHRGPDREPAPGS
jgi:hypothetical protein